MMEQSSSKYEHQKEKDLPGSKGSARCDDEHA